MLISVILLVLFLAGMVAVGLWGMRKTKTLNDFFLGGRTVGPWISAIAYGTTYFSAVLFIGFAGNLGWASACRCCGSRRATCCSAPWPPGWC
jgi:SSS family solute:Na+ symporter